MDHQSLIMRGTNAVQEASRRLSVWLFCRARRAMEGESGMATIEVLLIIAVLIALVMMFKDTIIDFVSDLLGNISGQGTSFDPANMVP